LELYKYCLAVRPIGDSEKNITGDSIVDLRNAIRKELGFGLEADKDRMSSWIVTLHASKEASALVQEAEGASVQLASGSTKLV
jgi:hypothetical protein